MDIPNGIIPAVQDYFERLYSMDSEIQVLETICPALSSIVYSDFYGLFLFPNVVSKQPLFCTNNPSDFIKAYNESLSYSDIFTERMVSAGNQTAVLHEILPPGAYAKSEFLNESDKYRGKKEKDGCYFPVIIDAMLSGFIAFGRFEDYPEYYSDAEIELLSFLVSFIPAGVERALEVPPPSSHTAYINGYGEVVSAGDEMKAILMEILGTRYWNRPCLQKGRNGEHMKRMIGSMLKGSISIGKGEVDLEAGGRRWTLRFRSLSNPEDSFRRYFPKQPQITASLQTVRLEEGWVFLEPAFQKYSISAREQTLVRLLYQGYSNSEIAKALQISEATVKHHLYNICNKTGAGSRTQLVFLLTRGY